MALTICIVPQQRAIGKLIKMLAGEQPLFALQTYLTPGIFARDLQ